jgi:hypothetical protein
MRLPTTILIFSFVFINSMSFALSEDALAIIAHYRKKYNNNEELARPSAGRVGSLHSNNVGKEMKTASKPSTSGFESDSIANLADSSSMDSSVSQVKKSYISDTPAPSKESKALGESLSAALNRYRLARKTGQIAPTQALTTAVSGKTDSKQKPRLKRYNYSFALQGSEETEAQRLGEQKPAKAEPKQARAQRQKKAARITKNTDSTASSKELLERSEKELQKGRNSIKLEKSKNIAADDGKLSHPAIVNSSREREEDGSSTNFVLPKLDSEKPSPDSTDAVVATQQDDDDFNQFIRRYDFKMPDNYRIIVR